MHVVQYPYRRRRPGSTVSEPHRKIGRPAGGLPAGRYASTCADPLTLNDAAVHRSISAKHAAPARTTSARATNGHTDAPRELTPSPVVSPATNAAPHLLHRMRRPTFAAWTFTRRRHRGQAEWARGYMRSAKYSPRGGSRPRAAQNPATRVSFLPPGDAAGDNGDICIAPVTCRPVGWPAVARRESWVGSARRILHDDTPLWCASPGSSEAPCR
jgi:hypothetical protein